ncbi:MAG: hypothetical protein ACOX7R_09055 [Acetivibrionales bacterium]
MPRRVRQLSSTGIYHIILKDINQQRMLIEIKARNSSIKNFGKRSFR